MGPKSQVFQLNQSGHDHNPPTEVSTDSSVGNPCAGTTKDDKQEEEQRGSPTCLSTPDIMDLTDGDGKPEKVARQALAIKAGKADFGGPAAGTELCSTYEVPVETLKDPPLQREVPANLCVVNDSEAAIRYLKLLLCKFRQRRWPSSHKELKKFMRNSVEKSSWWIKWRQASFEDGLTVSKTRKKAFFRLMFQFERLGFVRNRGGSLVWNVAATKQILSRDYDARPTTETERDARSSRITIATSTVMAPFTGGHHIELVDSVEKLNQVLLIPTFARTEAADPFAETVAIDCEGVPDNLFLIQVGTVEATYVFDCVKLSPPVVCMGLAKMLLDYSVLKLFHDLHNDSAALKQVGGIDMLRGTLDTQLVSEHLTGELFVGFDRMLKMLGGSKHPLKSSMKVRMDGGRLFSQRPIPKDVLEYAALDVSLLLQVQPTLLASVGTSFAALQRASDARAAAASLSGGARQIAFDELRSCSMASLELLQELRPGDMLVPAPLEVSDDTPVLLAMLPDDLSHDLRQSTRDLSDIVIDKGREPCAWVGGNRKLLGGPGRRVNTADIEAIVDKLGGFGHDNRAGLQKQLHRISAIRNRQADIIGLTMRVGRHVTGNATIISDLMFGDVSRSILFLGEPGSGKTTVVREVTRLLAERFNVCIVDTSNEIAGDGDIPHPCVGYARRMMVQSLDEQSDVMIECVQNHAPEVMVIDEIGRSKEVEAARTCKQRGVRLIASAHGDLRKLIKNPSLRGLVGGVETVTLGDDQAKKESRKLGNSDGSLRKLKAQRAGLPCFDYIIELRRGAHHEWTIIMDVGDAVDKVLEGLEYKAQRRTRNPDTGAIQLQLECV